MKLPHTAHPKHSFLVKTKENPKYKRKIPKEKVSLELLLQRLGHRSTSSQLDVDIGMFWKDTELRVDTEPFCTS